MTQALQISMLMLTADSPLKPDSLAANGFAANNIVPQSETAAPEEGTAIAFGTLLNGMVQPAKTGNSTAAMRQIPAAAGVLSAVSAAMLQAAQGADEAGNADTALANNLLLQIALNNKTDSQTDIETANADSPPAADAGGDMPLTAEQIAATLVQPGHSAHDTANENTTILAETALKNAAADTAEANTGQQTLAAKVTADTAGTPPAAAQHTAAETDLQPDTAPPSLQHAVPAEQEHLAAADNKLHKAPETAAPETVKQQTEAKDRAQVVAAAGLADNANSTVMAAGDNTAGLPTAATQGTTSPADSHAERVTAATQNPATAADDKTEPVMAAIQNAAAPVDSKTERSVAAAISNPDETATTKAPATETIAVTVAAQPQTKADISAKDKTVTVKTDTDKTDNVKADSSAVIKTAAAEPGAQHQQQGQAQSERQFAAMEQLASTVKTTTESGAQRTESVFSTSLQAAESRQQGSVSTTVAKSATEQLKQSLDLQQQDAAGQLRERVNLMVRHNIQIAEIRLDPAGLGQMQIKVDLQQDQANVQFIVQQPQAKELLEQQLPRLRDLLQQQGIVLGEGSVQQQSQQERQLAERQHQQNGPQGPAGDAIADDAMPAQVKVAAADRLVDYYA